MSFDAARLAARSVEVILEHQAPSGAYPAAPTPTEYRNCWLRDGAFIADGMSRAGAVDSADAFFAWCARLVLRRRARIEDLVGRRRRGETILPEEHLECRYTLEGEKVPGEWPSFQLDGYGAWLWALGAHAGRHERDVSTFAEAVELTLAYVSAFALDPTYDWWEERLGQHSVSLAAVQAGLAVGGRLPFVERTLRDETSDRSHEVRAAIRDDAGRRGRLARTLGADELDGSLVACSTPFRALAPDDPHVAATVAALEGQLAHEGVHRYGGDTYYGGGEWILLAALLGWHYAETGREADARRQLDWIVAHADERGELPEQVADHVLAPECLPVWEQRWGPAAHPLLWSHAMLLSLVDALGAGDRRCRT